MKFQQTVILTQSTVLLATSENQTKHFSIDINLHLNLQLRSFVFEFPEVEIHFPSTNLFPLHYK